MPVMETRLKDDENRLRANWLPGGFEDVSTRQNHQGRAIREPNLVPEVTKGCIELDIEGHVSYSMVV